MNTTRNWGTMMLPRRPFKGLLRDNSGIDTSVPELAVSTIVKTIISATLVSVVAGVLLASAVTTTSASTAASFQDNGLQFQKAVAESTSVEGFGSNAVALLTTDSGQCDIDLWHAYSNSDGTTSLREDKSTTAGACTQTTTVSLGEQPGGSELLADIQSAQFSYQNIGGRALTFDSSGHETLATQTQPATVDDADWTDTRPYMVQMTVGSAKDHLTAFAKNATFTGYTQIVNAPQATGTLNYVPSTVPMPSALRIIGVTRSTTVGTSYSGAREGAAVSITGAVCPSAATNLTVTYTAATPAGVPVSTLTKVVSLTGAVTTYQLAGVPNGSQGTVEVDASCGTGGETTTARVNYQQQVPKPTLTAVEASPFSTHDLTYTQVSSLPTNFTGTWKGNDGTSGTIPARTALTDTVVHPAYSTYGVTDTYTITANVNGVTAASAPATVTHAWPTIPTATGLSYTSTGTAPVKGTVKWSYTGACPVGTTLYSSYEEDRTGTSAISGGIVVGKLSTTINYQSPWTAGLTNYVWQPTYATQGTEYGDTVLVECVITSTKAASAASATTYTWVTPMPAPKAPVWASYNVFTRVDGVNWTYSTSPGVDTIAVQYDTYCPAGSYETSGQLTSHSWDGSAFVHAWPYSDWWQLPAGSGNLNVSYGQTTYVCTTGWDQVTSGVGASETVTVEP